MRKLLFWIMLMMMFFRSGVHTYRILTEKPSKYDPPEEIYKKIVELYEKIG